MPKMKLWLLNCFLLLDTEKLRGHITGLQPDISLARRGKIGLRVLCQQNTAQKKLKVSFVFSLALSVLSALLRECTKTNEAFLSFCLKDR